MLPGWRRAKNYSRIGSGLSATLSGQCGTGRIELCAVIGIVVAVHLGHALIAHGKLMGRVPTGAGDGI